MDKIFEIVDEIFKTAVNLKTKKTNILIKETEKLRSIKKLPLRRSDYGLNSGVMQAAGYAKKHNRIYYVYQGNSYGNLVYIVTYKKNDAFNPINNNGNIVLEINPELEIKQHILDRK